MNFTEYASMLAKDHPIRREPRRPDGCAKCRVLHGEPAWLADPVGRINGWIRFCVPCLRSLSAVERAILRMESR